MLNPKVVQRESLQAIGVAFPVIDLILSHQKQQQQHRNVAEGVFILYRGDDNDAEPIGTAFAISEKLLLTACHNVVVKSTDGETTSTVLNLKVAAAMSKTPDGTILAEPPQRAVSVHTYNIAVDWAALVLDGEADRFPLTSVIPLAKQSSDIPSPGTSEKLYIYHCPIQLFLDDAELDRCHVMQKEASVGIVGKKHSPSKMGRFQVLAAGRTFFGTKPLPFIPSLRVLLEPLRK